MHNNNISIYEYFVTNYLYSHKVRYAHEWAFSDLKGDYDYLRFDFAIFNAQNELKALIEVQGSHHYKPTYGQEAFEKQQRYDKLKLDYCTRNNIPLLCLNTGLSRNQFYGTLKNFLKKFRLLYN